jgi:hypothetical protein
MTTIALLAPDVDASDGRLRPRVIQNLKGW